jgi:D-amino-acid dehydrogenase
VKARQVAVVGAGIVGVASAYALAEAGHEVTVFEARGAVAEGTSFANAGVLAPGYVTPWAAPGMPLKVLSQLFSAHAAVRLSGLRWLGELPWLWRWWRACSLASYQANRSALHALAMRSQQVQQRWVRELQLEFEQAQGYLVLLRREQERRAAERGLALLRDLGVSHSMVDAAQARRLEPGLNPQTPLAGAVHLPQDGLGNCRLFAQQLKTQAHQRGVRFAFERAVTSLTPGLRPGVHHRSAAPASGQKASTQSETFDAVVVCAGVDSVALLKPHGLKLPLTAVWGYSLTAPLRHFEAYPDAGPHAALMDERFKVAISRLGQRVRVAGSAELAGRAGHFHPGAMATLYRVLNDWFPGVAQLAQAQRWKGARPMLPDGPPLVGTAGLPGLWLNLGHGSSGWALACGSADLLTHMLAGDDPGLDASRFALSRLG